MASLVEIGNRALQRLGARRIVALTDDSTNARAVNAAFESVKLAELRKYVWSFATKRATLAAESAAPDFGRATAFQVPSDFIRLAPDYPEDNLNTKDWVIEGKLILTDDVSPLRIRYVFDVKDANLMDPLFREAFSAKLALELVEELTQSNTKKKAIALQYRDAIREARRASSIEKVAAEPATDSWITARETSAQSFPFTK